MFLAFPGMERVRDMLDPDTIDQIQSQLPLPTRRRGPVNSPEFLVFDSIDDKMIALSVEDPDVVGMTLDEALPIISKVCTKAVKQGLRALTGAVTDTGIHFWIASRRGHKIPFISGYSLARPVGGGVRITQKGVYFVTNSNYSRQMAEWMGFTTTELYQMRKDSEEMNASQLGRTCRRRLDLPENPNVMPQELYSDPDLWGYGVGYGLHYP